MAFTADETGHWRSQTSTTCIHHNPDLLPAHAEPMSQSPHLAHGLEGDTTPPDWPPLRLDEAREVLAHFPDAGEAQSIVWHSPRPFSAAARVATTQGVLFVKRHHQRVRTPATLGEEHRFIQHLHAQGLPVSKVLRDHAGHSTHANGEFVYEVQPDLAECDAYRDTVSWQPMQNLEHAFLAGQMLARLHQAATNYDSPQRQSHVLVARSELICASDPITALAQQLSQRPGLADYLAAHDWQTDLYAVLEPWQPRVHARLAAQIPCWTHGDWHASNLGWRLHGVPPEVAMVFDFGLAARNFALFDLATAIERNAIPWLTLDRHDPRIDIAIALIRGYHAQRSLTRDDLELLADLLPIVHVDFALSEVEYFHAITGSRANADLAYGEFLQGHAAWFNTAAGRALRDAIATAL